MSVNQVQFISSPKSNAQSFVAGDGTTLKTLRTYGANGGRTEHLRISSTDTNIRVMAFYINLGGSDLMIGAVSIPAGSTTAPANVDVLATLYPALEKQFIIGAAGAILKCAPTAAVGANTTYVFEDGGDY